MHMMIKDHAEKMQKSFKIVDDLQLTSKIYSRSVKLLLL